MNNPISSSALHNESRESADSNLASGNAERNWQDEMDDDVSINSEDMADLDELNRLAETTEEVEEEDDEEDEEDDEEEEDEDEGDDDDDDEGDGKANVLNAQS